MLPRREHIDDAVGEEYAQHALYGKPCRESQPSSGIHVWLTGDLERKRMICPTGVIPLCLLFAGMERLLSHDRKGSWWHDIWVSQMISDSSVPHTAYYRRDGTICRWGTFRPCPLCGFLQGFPERNRMPHRLAHDTHRLV